MPDTFATNTSEAIFNLEQKNTEQDGRLDTVESKDTTQDGRLDTIESGQTTQNGRLDTVEAKDTTQDGRLDAVEAKDTTQDGRLDALEAASGSVPRIRDRDDLGSQDTTVTWDWASESFGFIVTLTGNANIAAPTNPPTLTNTGDYVEGLIYLIQDSTGGRAPTWNDVWVNTPTLTGTGNTIAMIPFYYDGTSYVLGDPVEFTPYTPPAGGTPTPLVGSEGTKTQCDNDNNYYSSTFQPYEAWDGVSDQTATNDNAWLSKSTQSANPDGSCYLQWDFGAAKTIYSVRLMPRGGANANFPADCRVKVSNDATFATYLQSTDMSFVYTAAGTWTVREQLGTPVSAQYLRLEIHTKTQVGSGTWVSCQEVEFEELI